MPEEKENAAAAETDWQRRYEEEREAFGRYRAEAEAREAEGRRKERFRRICSAAGIPDERQAAILRLSDLAAGDGAEDADLAAALREAFGGEARTKGAPVPLPPRGGRAVTREEILSIRDAGERQAAIARNHELFGF